MIGFSDAQTKRQIDNNPNDFRLFENFELTRKVYINETKIVEKVQQIKVHLLKLKKIIEEYKNKTISFMDLQSSKLKSNINQTDIEAQCLKISKNVSFEFLNFGIFH